MKEFIKLGQKVRCKVTGFTGIVDHIAVYQFGCRRVNIQPPIKKDGTLPESQLFDEPQLEVLKEKQIISVEVPEQKFEFGQTVKDPISGVIGKVTGRAIYLNGCARVEISLKYNQKTNNYATNWLAEEQLELVGKKLSVKSKERKTGGTCSGSSKLKKSI
jgi:DNA-directed RNA polymerase subunit E'/Rpb7